MKKEEIQKLIREAFELGCSQGRAEYQIGYDKGVKDYAAGKVVVVDLPNGDTMVCETKEKP